MKVAILSANLGNFDNNTKDPVLQSSPLEVKFHRFTDDDFPPIAGLTPRLQYRISKLFGYEMFPGYDVYIWFDSSCSLQRPDCVDWYLEQLGDADMAFFRHPQRNSIEREVQHIEAKLATDHWYITPRYKNGLHREFLNIVQEDKTFKDDNLYASTAFIYRANEKSIEMLHYWWFYQSRYFTCDQVQLPYAIHKSGAKVNKIPDNLFQIGYLSLVTHHK